MSRFHTPKNTFAAGILGPELNARSDLGEYFQGADDLKNVRILPGISGGVSKRSGTVFVDELASNTNTTFGVYPFKTVEGREYIVEMSSSNTIRIKNSAGVTQTIGLNNPPSTFFSANNYNFTQINDVMIFVHPSGTVEPFTIARVSSTLGIDTFTVTSFFGDTYGNAYEPYAIDKLTSRYLKFPYQPINTSPTSITPSITSGTGNLQATNNIFHTGLVGAYIILHYFNATGAAPSRVSSVWLVNSFTDAQNITATLIYGSLPGASATDQWQFPYWDASSISSNNIVKGFPRTVSFFESRLVFGGSIGFQDSVWFSAQSNIYLFKESPLFQDIELEDESTRTIARSGSPLKQLPNTASAFNYSIGSNTSNSITFLVSGINGIYAGTTTSEYYLYSADGAISAETFQVRNVSNVGSLNIAPIQIGNNIIFVNKDAQKLTMFSLSPQNGSIQSVDIMELCPNLYLLNSFNNLLDNNQGTYNSAAINIDITKLAYNDREKLLYVIMSDGSLYTYTLNSKMGGWTRHIFNDVNITDADGEVKDIICIKDSINGIGATTTMYIMHRNGVTTLEKSASVASFEEFHITQIAPISGYIYLDCATVIGIPGTYFSAVGNSGLYNKEVALVSNYRGFIQNVNIDGSGVSDLEVASVGFSLGEIFMLGIPFETKIKTKALNPRGFLESSKGMIIRVDHVALDLLRAYSINVGINDFDTETIDLSDPNQASDEPIKLFTGTTYLPFRSGHNRETSVTVVSQDPYPMTLLGLYMRGQTHE